MKVGLQGWGSEGDLRPIVALAAALRRAGHSVRVDLTAVDGTDYVAKGRALGVEVRMLPDLLDFRMDSVASDAESVDPLKISRELVDRCFYPFLDQLYDAALQLCADCDVVVWHYSAWYTKAAALKTGVPSVSVQLFPGLAPTRAAPPPGLPSFGVLNPFLWSVARAILDLQFRKRPAQFLERHGLPKLKHVLPELMFSEQLNLHAASPLLLPRPADWDESHQICGQLTLPSDADGWAPSDELRAFLAEGRPPVLFSLGSMEHFAPKRAHDLFVDAARAAGVRAIIQTKRAKAERRDGELYFLGWAPHDALLGSCALMIHHGGAGTTHSAARAGVPFVVVPVIMEQQLWANRLRATGATGDSLPFWKTTAAKLGAAVRSTLDSASIKERARVLGDSMSREDGTATAVGLIERLAM